MKNFLLECNETKNEKYAYDYGYNTDVKHRF